MAVAESAAPAASVDEEAEPPVPSDDVLFDPPVVELFPVEPSPVIPPVAPVAAMRD